MQGQKEGVVLVVQKQEQLHQDWRDPVIVTMRRRRKKKKALKKKEGEEMTMVQVLRRLD